MTTPKNLTDDTMEAAITNDVGLTEDEMDEAEAFERVTPHSSPQSKQKVAMKTTTHDGQRFESIETAVSRLVQESDAVQVDNQYLPALLAMAAQHEITIVGNSNTKGYTTVSAFPKTAPAARPN